MTALPILHFNDVYRVQPFKLHPKSPETIDVTQWAAMLDDLRDQWPERPDGNRDGLVLFSGDVFSPSVESSVTRGSHMVPVLNAIAPDVSMTGNHDFDFGYPHLTELIKDTNFPWVLSNVIDNTTGRTPEHVQEYHVIERAGVRIGVIGLIEKEWIGTISSWPPNFEYRDMAQRGIALSKQLRDPNGEHKCDLIIALTHARVPNDIELAKALAASSPAAQEVHPIDNEHGVDIILGGHDHLYYVARGATSWEGYDLTHPVLGAERDEGDVLIVKSGTDFRDLSEFTLTLEDTKPGSIRRKVIKELRGARHSTQPNSKKNARIAKLLESILSSVSDALKAPVCKTEVELDLRSQLIRVQESAAANWFADVLRHCYDEAPEMAGGSDGVFICAGTLRGDSVYGPGLVTLGDILEILPFEDPIVALELDGEAVWDALEQSLSTWPAQEGRFPTISGFRVSWDSRRPPGQRVLGVWLLQEPSGSVNTSASPTPMHSANVSTTSLPSGAASPAPVLVDAEPIERTKGGRKYRMITREYMAQGFDGFLALKGQKYLVDDEGGQLMSQLVRKYLLGCRYVNRMSRMSDISAIGCLDPQTHSVISKEKARREDYDRRHHAHHVHPNQARDHSRSRSKTPHHLSVDTPSSSRERSPSPSVVYRWKHAARRALRWSRAHYRDNIHITGREHMSPVDHFDGSSLRKQQAKAMEDAKSEAQEKEKEDAKRKEKEDEEDLAVIHPIVDGRLKDEGRN